MESLPGLQKMKKIEIVTEAMKLDQVLSILDQAGVSGYTIISHVTGCGRRGRRLGGGLTDAFKNVMVMAVVEEPLAVKILEGVKKLIQNFAGMAVVTDASVLWPDYGLDRSKPLPTS